MPYNIPVGRNVRKANLEQCGATNIAVIDSSQICSVFYMAQH
jgi:hypothetical protein